MRLVRRWVVFLFPKESDTWLALFRIGLALSVAFYALSLRSDWNLLFASQGNGLVSRDLAEAVLSAESPLAPRLGWLVICGSHLGLGEEAILSMVWFGLCAAGCLLLLGLFCRPVAILAWFLHLCSVKSGDLFSYGTDNFTTIGLFYLMLCPFPDRYSLDRLWRRLPEKDPRVHGFYRRVLQLHLCFIYFFGGLAKSLGHGWWNGTTIWRALTRPPFNALSADTIVAWQFALPLLGIFICALEIGYPIFIWPQKTRALWLTFALSMHAAIAFTMGLYLFSFIMIVLNVAAFGPANRRPQPRPV